MSYGTSTFASIEFVTETIHRVGPKTICDVGCGYGRWGFLAREILDIWPGRHHPADWQTEITGIDIHAGSWNPANEWCYDRLLLADVAELWSTPPEEVDEFEQIGAGTYDLIIACDVIEHLEKERGRFVLEQIVSRSRFWIVGIPIGPGWLRGGREENEYEAHLAEWNESELKEVLSGRFMEGRLFQLTWEGEAGLEYGVFTGRGDR